MEDALIILEVEYKWLIDPKSTQLALDFTTCTTGACIRKVCTWDSVGFSGTLISSKLHFLQTSLSEGKEVCQQTAFKVRVRTLKNWRGFVTLALVNCLS